MLERRVVVTGLGLICGVGNTAPEVWEGLMAGKSGMAEITAFDLTGHPVRFAAEVKNFDALKFVDKKEARKMGRFIAHFFGRPAPPQGGARSDGGGRSPAGETVRSAGENPSCR